MLTSYQADLLADALTVQPIGFVPDSVRSFVESWYGPRCARLEVIGYSSTEYDDERTTEHGSIQVLAYTAEGERLEALFVADDDDTESSYWEALDEAREEGEDEPKACTEGGTWDHDLHNARERFIDERACLPENAKFFWGPDESDPYTDQRALLAKIATTFQGD